MLLPGRRPPEGEAAGARVAEVRALHGQGHEAGGQGLPGQARQPGQEVGPSPGFICDLLPSQRSYSIFGKSSDFRTASLLNKVVPVCQVFKYLNGFFYITGGVI